MTDLGAPMTVLHTVEQRQLETQARTLVQEPAVVEAKARALAALSATEHASDPATMADLPGYVDGLALAQALGTLNSDPTRPRILWGQQPDRRFGLDNPDNLYRSVPVDAASSYVITGRRNSAYDVYMQLLDANPGDGTLGNTLGFLQGRDLATGPDGTFTITVDARPTSSAPNHIQLTEGAKVLVFRDTLSDWATQTPMALEIERTGGAVAAPPSRDELAAETARRITAHATFWNDYVGMIHLLPANSFSPTRPSEGGLPGQVTSFGRWDLQPGEALVVSADPAGAGYLGLGLSSNWFISIDYWDHLSSANDRQVVTGPDGTITFVLSAEDPGVHNWLDTLGHASGLVLLRWQGLAADVVPPELTFTTVPLDRLDGALPAGIARITPSARAQQLAARRAAFDRRGATLPAAGPQG